MDFNSSSYEDLIGKHQDNVYPSKIKTM